METYSRCSLLDVVEPDKLTGVQFQGWRRSQPLSAMRIGFSHDTADYTRKVSANAIVDKQTFRLRIQRREQVAEKIVLHRITAVH